MEFDIHHTTAVSITFDERLANSLAEENAMVLLDFSSTVTLVLK